MRLVPTLRGTVRLIFGLLSLLALGVVIGLALHWPRPVPLMVLAEPESVA
jgi:hypothetical protein